MSKSNAAFAAILVFVLLLAIIVGLSGGLSRPDDTRRVLGAQGYTDIKITGWRPLMAGEDDTFSTGFSARSPGGSQHVTGAVTSGLWKGHTIRLD